MSKEKEKIIAEFFKNKPVKRAYLFGSSARNEETELSDIDLLVELDYSKPIGLGFVKMKLELERLLNRKVDLLSSEGVSKYVKPYIDLEKVLVYEK